MPEFMEKRWNISLGTHEEKVSLLSLEFTRTKE